MYRKVQVASRFLHNCHMLGNVEQKVQVDHKVQVCNRHILHKVQVLEEIFNEIFNQENPKI